MRDAANNHFYSDYDIFSNNCGDLVYDAMTAAGFGFKKTWRPVVSVSDLRKNSPPGKWTYYNLRIFAKNSEAKNLWMPHEKQ